MRLITRSALNRSAVGIAALVTCSGTAHAQSVPLRAVAVSGQPAPGAGAGVTFAAFNIFQSQSITAGGRIAFRATLAGPGVTAANNEGLWSDAAAPSPGSFSLVARTGDPMPDSAGGSSGATLTNFFFSAPVVSDSGWTSFRGNVAGAGVTGANDFGAWARRTAVLQLVVREGDQAPGYSAGQVFQFGNATATAPELALDAAGRATFSGEVLVGGDSWPAVWSVTLGAPGTLTTVARRGVAPPGIAPGPYFTGFSAPSINPSGRIGFFGLLSTFINNGVANYPGAGAWRTAAAAPVDPTLTLVLRNGTVAPGFDGTAQFLAFSDGTFGSSSQFAFTASVFGGSAGTLTQGGLFRAPGNSGNPELLFKAGTQAPGLPAGQSLSVLRVAAAGDAGSVYIYGGLSGAGVTAANDTALFASAPVTGGVAGPLTLLAREGSAAPDTPAGVVFADLGALLNLQPVINARGQVAFRCTLAGAGVTAANNDAIFATDPQGRLKLVARSGSVIDVNPDAATDNRTIASLIMCRNAASDGGKACPINDDGALVFAAAFTDSSSALLHAAIGNAVTCPPDLGVAGGAAGNDGLLDNNDFIAFITHFFNADPRADMGVSGGLPGHDGQFDNNDFIAFITLYFQAC